MTVITITSREAAPLWARLRLAVPRIGLIGAGAALHAAFHALPLAQVFFGGAALACHL